MRKLLQLLLAIMFLFNVSNTYGQKTASIEGTVTDMETGETLIGVNITLTDHSGTATDIDGKYQLNVAPGKHIVNFSYIGYANVEKRLQINDGESVTLNIELSSDAQELDIVVVSGSLYEKKLSEETVSIDVVKSDLIQNVNATSLAEAVQKAPGVYMIDEQANIRGGTGFTYGAGSRVMVVIDDQPLLTADRGDVKWSFIPLENVEQIEVIKGASSVLYGSSALNGVINVRTAWPGSEPESNVTLYGGTYSKPKAKYKAWWNTPPIFSGASFSHRQKFKNWDLVLGGHVSNHQTHLVDKFSNRARLNFKTRIRPKKTDRITYGLNGNMMYSRDGIFFLWDDSDSSQYLPFGGSFGEPQSSIYIWKYNWLTLDPWFTCFDKKGGSHHFKSRLYLNKTWYEQDTTEGLSFLNNIDYRFQKEFFNKVNVTAGFSGYRFNSDDDKLGVNKGFLGGLYMQMDKKFWDKLSVNVGARWEVYQLKDEGSGFSIPIFKAGLNYKAAPKSYVRASFGQGYRAPSLVELNSETNLGILYIFPNDTLDPEYGWNAEIGYKRNLGGKNWFGYLDIAAYWTEYFDMTEFTAGFYGPNENLFGFKSLNLSRARLAGIEFTAVGQGQIGKVGLNFTGGYNYVYPADLVAAPEVKNVGTFMKNFFKGLVKDHTDSTFMSTVLRYRFRHMFRLDVEAEYWKFNFGIEMSYFSYMEKIDEIFTDFGIPPGIAEFREANQTGTFVMGVRGSYRINEMAKISLIVDNVLNKDYALRVAHPDPPRNFTLQCSVDF